MNVFPIHIIYRYFMILNRTKLTRGRKPGHYFQDETNIAYIAKDKAGNLNSCSFNVNVKGNVNVE